MNGIIVIDKPKDYTSRDIVNIVSKKLNTKKVGHTGTLDPLATGVLVLPIGRALKVSELLTSNTKEYIAEVILGYETDMLDITGTEIKRNIPNVTKEELLKVLKSYIGKYNQEVPLYSAVKVGGRKLYEYARSGTTVIPPSKEVEVYSLELISDLKHINGAVEFTIRCEVSKGTYIRSLIRDIAYSLNTYGTMKNLIRTRQGIFTLIIISITHRNVSRKRTIRIFRNNIHHSPHCLRTVKSRHRSLDNLNTFHIIHINQTIINIITGPLSGNTFSINHK